jgi:CelD/BcsL family acetyltransferase involved in cellulose biosynthesis
MVPGGRTCGMRAPFFSCRRHWIPVFEIAPHSSHADLERLRPEWLALFHASGTSNPFAHPEWAIAWARSFVGPSEPYVLALRDRGELVGVAPFFRRGRLVTSIRMLGGGRGSQLVEMPQVLAAQGQSRRVLRAVVGYLCERTSAWDWAEISLGPGQGWFEREWIPRHGPGSGCVAMHKQTRAFVVVPLDATWDAFRGRLKRNVKESIRRGANRLGRESHEWRVVEPHNGDLDSALDTIIALHRARARMTGAEPHSDYFADSREEAFLHDVGGRLHGEGGFIPLLLEVDGRTVAGRLVLETPEAAFFSVSGADPDWWHYNVGTTLLAHSLRREIERARVVANLSDGPDVSKLRWSEQVEYAPSFLLVGERLRSRVAFAAFWHARAEYMRRNQRHRQLQRTI